MFRRIHTRMSWASLNVGAPRSVFQARTVYPPGHAEGRTGVEMKVWSHGLYKCAKIVRIQFRHLSSSTRGLAFVADLFLSLFFFFFFFQFPVSKGTFRRER